MKGGVQKRTNKVAVVLLVVANSLTINNGLFSGPRCAATADAAGADTRCLLQAVD